MSKISYRVITLLLASATEIYNLSPDTLVHLLWIRSCRRLASHSVHRHNTAHLVYFVWMMKHWVIKANRGRASHILESDGITKEFLNVQPYLNISYRKSE